MARNEREINGDFSQESNSCENKKHWRSRERLYVLWLGIRQRCNNQNHISYKHYGAKGIKVCPEWEDDYMTFKKWALETGYDETLPRGAQTIERKDTNGDYCPENCEWKTIQEQQKNKNGIKLYDYKGEKHNIKEWSDILGIDYSLLHNRISGLHWSIKDAIEIPFNQRREEGDFMYANFKGERKTLFQISKEEEISYEILVTAYKAGKSIEDTIREYKENGNTFSKKYEFDGKKLTISEWSKELGVSKATLRSRISAGKPYDKVFTTQKNIYSKRKSKKAED